MGHSLQPKAHPRPTAYISQPMAHGPWPAHSHSFHHCTYMHVQSLPTICPLVWWDDRLLDNIRIYFGPGQSLDNYWIFLDPRFDHYLSKYKDCPPFVNTAGEICCWTLSGHTLDMDKVWTWHWTLVYCPYPMVGQYLDKLWIPMSTSCPVTA